MVVGPRCKRLAGGDHQARHAINRGTENEILAAAGEKQRVGGIAVEVTAGRRDGQPPAQAQRNQGRKTQRYHPVRRGAPVAHHRKYGSENHGKGQVDQR